MPSPHPTKETRDETATANKKPNAFLGRTAPKKASDRFSESKAPSQDDFTLEGGAMLMPELG